MRPNRFCPQNSRCPLNDVGLSWTTNQELRAVDFGSRGGPWAVGPIHSVFGCFWSPQTKENHRRGSSSSSHQGLYSFGVWRVTIVESSSVDLQHVSHACASMRSDRMASMASVPRFVWAVAYSRVESFETSQLKDPT